MQISKIHLCLLHSQTLLLCGLISGLTVWRGSRVFSQHSPIHSRFLHLSLFLIRVFNFLKIFQEKIRPDLTSIQCQSYRWEVWRELKVFPSLPLPSPPLTNCTTILLSFVKIFNSFVSFVIAHGNLFCFRGTRDPCWKSQAKMGKQRRWVVIFSNYPYCIFLLVAIL